MASNFQSAKVGNVGFLIDRMGQDCEDTQQYRELTRNSMQAIDRTGPNGKGGTGRIEWRHEDVPYIKNGKPGIAHKITCTDNGDGMTGSQMEKYIGELSSSGSTQNMSGNYGMGAKIAAATRNPEGIEYRSWRGDEAYKVRFHKNPQGAYGFERFQVMGDDGVTDLCAYAPIGDTGPKGFKGFNGTGTQVVLMGQSLESDTTRPPPSLDTKLDEKNDRWLVRYLNMRFFRIPENIEISVQEDWTRLKGGGSSSEEKKGGVTRKVHGQEALLNAGKQASGVVSVEGANVHWWIINPAKLIKGHLIKVTAMQGHVAALYQDELHDVMLGRSGQTILNEFGIVCGARNVILYVEPTVKNMTTDTSRTHILVNNAGVPWSEYATEFRSKIPQAIQDFMETAAAEDKGAVSSKDYRDRIDHQLFSLNAYKASRRGTVEVDSSQSFGGGTLDGGGKREINKGTHGPTIGTGTGGAGGGAGSGGTHGASGTVYRTKSKGGIKATAMESDIFPDVVWVNSSSNAWDDNLLGRAALYSQENHLLKINEEFPIFIDLTERLAREHAKKGVVQPHIKQVVDKFVRTWVEQTLVETVIGVDCTKGTDNWSKDERQATLTPVSLSAVFMPRTLIFKAIRQGVNSALGKPND